MLCSGRPETPETQERRRSKRLLSSLTVRCFQWTARNAGKSTKEKTKALAFVFAVRFRVPVREREKEREREMGAGGFVMVRRIWKLASAQSGSVLCRSVFASGRLEIRSGYSSSSFRIQTLSPENYLGGSEFPSHVRSCCYGGLRRSFATGSVNQEEQNKIVDAINTKFAEAREEIELAMESKETVYFDEEAESARAAVKVVLDAYDGLIARLDESERGALQRSMGLKMEQLKAELQQLND